MRRSCCDKCGLRGTKQIESISSFKPALHRPDGFPDNEPNLPGSRFQIQLEAYASYGNRFNGPSEHGARGGVDWRLSPSICRARLGELRLSRGAAWHHALESATRFEPCTLVALWAAQRTMA